MDTYERMNVISGASQKITKTQGVTKEEKIKNRNERERHLNNPAKMRNIIR